MALTDSIPYNCWIHWVIKLKISLVLLSANPLSYKLFLRCKQLCIHMGPCGVLRMSDLDCSWPAGESYMFRASSDTRSLLLCWARIGFVQFDKLWMYGKTSAEVCHSLISLLQGILRMTTNLHKAVSGMCQFSFEVRFVYSILQHTLLTMWGTGQKWESKAVMM
jgi:hypothetical protein